jgi:hypothetical protein
MSLSQPPAQPLSPVKPDPALGCLLGLLITIGRLVVHLFVVLLIFGALCGAYMGASQFFDQEDTKLPIISQWVYGWSYRMNHHFHVLIPGFLLVDAIALAGLQFLPKPFNWLARAWFSAVLVAAAIGLTMVSFAIAIPLRAMVAEPATEGSDASATTGDQTPQISLPELNEKN